MSGLKELSASEIDAVVGGDFLHWVSTILHDIVQIYNDLVKLVGDAQALSYQEEYNSFNC